MEYQSTGFKSLLERSNEDVRMRAEALSNYLFSIKQCQRCLSLYNFDSNLPRVLVQCGHSICSLCVTDLVVDQKISCPFCNMQLTRVSSPEALPINQQIFVSLQKNKEEKEESQQGQQMDLEALQKCDIHRGKYQHYYCLKHEIQLCKACIVYHTQKSKCEIIDLVTVKKNVE